MVHLSSPSHFFCFGSHDLPSVKNPGAALDAFDAARGFFGVPHDNVLPTPGSWAPGKEKQHPAPKWRGKGGKLKLFHIFGLFIYIYM